jgi:hypothetical protein
MFCKIAQRLVELGASFFADNGRDFGGDVALLSKVVDGGDDRSCPGLKSWTQSAPSHKSPYCTQSSGYEKRERSWNA